MCVYMYIYTHIHIHTYTVLNVYTYLDHERPLLPRRATAHFVQSTQLQLTTQISTIYTDKH